MTDSTVPVNAKPLTPSWDLLRPNWALVQAHLTNIMFLVILPALLLSWGSVVSNQAIATGVSISLIGLIWTLVNQAPIVLFALRAAQGKALSLADCYKQGLRYFWRLLGLELFLGLIIVLGFIALIIPGIVAIVLIIQRYYLAPYYMFDQNLSIKDALGTSREQTAPYVGYIWGIFGTQVVISIAGSMAGFVHPVVAVITSTLAAVAVLFLPALRYQEVHKASASS